MKAARVKRLEQSQSSRFFSLSWREANNGVAIKESSYLLDLLQKLNREPMYSEFIIGGKHLIIDPEDRAIVDRIDGDKLYLAGLDKPHRQTVGIKWGTNESK